MLSWASMSEAAQVGCLAIFQDWRWVHRATWLLPGSLDRSSHSGLFAWLLPESENLNKYIF